MNDFSVTILGSNSALPAHNRHPSAQIIRINQSLILMDCGEGTQFRLKKLRISPMKIRTICISHLHGDHVYGLPGLLTSFILLRRTEPLVLIGPSGIRDFIYAVFSSTYTTLPYPLEIIETDTLHFGQVYETEDFSIFNIPLVHSIPCNGYLFKSKQGTANIKKELINEYHLDVEEIKRLKANTSVRREDHLITPEEVLYMKNPPVSYAYCSDTAYDNSICIYIEGIDVLYHESTYMSELADKARERGHSTSYDAAQIALEAKVGKLLLGHPSSKYASVDSLIEEARLVFPNTEFATEGVTYIL